MPHPFIFFGSPEFAKDILIRLIDAGFIPSALVCNPDKPFGRKKIITPPPTKKLILEKGLDVPIFQPSNKQELLELKENNLINQSDFAIVAAYSRIIPKEIIEIFKKGVLGVHPSLLPHHRGASPIQTTILEGGSKTGTSIYLLDDLMDHGPVFIQRSIDIGETENYLSLESRLAQLSADGLISILPLFIEGKMTPSPQDESLATFTKKFATEDGLVDLEKENPQIIAQKIRALNPDPGVYSLINGKRIKLLEVQKIDDKLVITKTQTEGKKPIESRMAIG